MTIINLDAKNEKGENIIDVDGDGKNDRVSFAIEQVGADAVKVTTYVDLTKDGYGKLNYDPRSQVFSLASLPAGWALSDAKFINNKLLISGKGTDGKNVEAKELSWDQLSPVPSKVEMQEEQLTDEKIAWNTGVLAALRDDAALDKALAATGFTADMMSGISHLISTKGTQMGTGGLGARGSGMGGGGTAEGLVGLGTRGRGSGASGYGTGGGNFGAKGEGGIGTVGGDPIILGPLDKSLVDTVIKRNMAQIRYCYQKELTKNPTLSGKITVKFVIAKDGTVSSATTKSSTMNNPTVENAINALFMKFQFPQPAGGGIVIVSYPFIFSPG